MKDALGHGSNPRGGAEVAKAARAKLTRGADAVMRDHLNFTTKANQEVRRALSGASHQSLIGKLGTGIKTFAKDTSGSGSDDNGLLGLSGFPDVYKLGKESINEYAHKTAHAFQQHADTLHHMVDHAKHFFG